MNSVDPNNEQIALIKKAGQQTGLRCYSNLSDSQVGGVHLWVTWKMSESRYGIYEAAVAGYFGLKRLK